VPVLWNGFLEVGKTFIFSFRRYSRLFFLFFLWPGPAPAPSSPQVIVLFPSIQAQLPFALVMAIFFSLCFIDLGRGPITFDDAGEKVALGG